MIADIFSRMPFTSAIPLSQKISSTELQQVLVEPAKSLLERLVEP